MKKLTYLLLLTALISSCTAFKPSERAERRIARIYKKFPELIKQDTIETQSDTIKLFTSDTILVDKKILDSLLIVLTDTVYKVDKQVIIKRIKEECKEKIITNTEVRTVIKYKTINKGYPVATKPTILDLIGLVWWWLLIALLIGFKVLKSLTPKLKV